MLETLLGGLISANCPTDLVSLKLSQNGVGFLGGNLEAERLTSGPEFTERPIKGRGAEGR